MKASLLTEPTNKTTMQNQWALLRLIAPPQAVIHIGAGNGKGELHQWRQWQVPYALLIEAELAKLDWANSSLAENPHWQTATVVLSDENTEADFFIASNPAEDGLIAAEHLRALWPNLKTQAQQKRKVQTLDSLLQTQAYQDLQQAGTVWAIIDCLSSLAILKGAVKALENWSVLSLRVLLNPLAEPNSIGTLQDIEAYLLPYGYRCIQLTESNNPLIGEALFVRDWQAVLQPKNHQLSLDNLQLFTETSLLQQQCEQQTHLQDELQQQVKRLEQSNEALVQDKATLTEREATLQAELSAVVNNSEQQIQLANERLAHIDTLTQERDQLGQQAAERQTQLEVLTQEKAAFEQEKASLIQSRDTLSNEVTALNQARDQQAQLANERQAHINVLTQERDQFAQQAAARQTQLEVLTQANAVVEQEKNLLIQSRDALSNEVAALNQARDQQAQLANERQAHINALTQERDQLGQQAAERQTQLESLTQEKAAFEQEKTSLIQSRDALNNELAATQQVRDQQAQLAAERQIQIENLVHERNHHAQQAQQLQSQVDELNQTNTLLNQEKSAFAEQQAPLKNELAALKQSVDQQALSLSQSHTECEQLHAQLQQQEDIMANLKAHYSESDAHQRLLNNEMLKAEAQLELIKDVLLREPGL
jgi:chromosome segregation ATPase